MRPLARRCASVALTAAFLALVCACAGGPDDKAGRSGQSASQGDSHAGKWYTGGTLHKKTALDWQEADHADKMATAADWVFTMWREKAFIPGIQAAIRDPDDTRTYAEELVRCIDAATKKDPDEEKNRRMYANQPVAELAAAGMVLMGWTKK